jgi:hypothetical protein
MFCNVRRAFNVSSWNRSSSTLCFSFFDNSYRVLNEAIDGLEQQRRQTLQQLDQLRAMRTKALQDPIAFVEKMVNKVSFHLHVQEKSNIHL